LGQAVGQVVVQAHDAFKIYGLTGAIERPLGVDVDSGLVGRRILISPDPIIVEVCSAAPLAGSKAKGCIVFGDGKTGVI
jgi:hypothetical protein